MKGWLSRLLLLPGAMVLLAVPLAASASAAVGTDLHGSRAAETTRAAGSYNVNLAGYMLDAANVPAGFQPNGQLTGPLDAARVKALWGPGTEGLASLIHGYVRDWVSAPTHVSIFELILDFGTRTHATDGLGGFETSMKAQAINEQPLTGLHTEVYVVAFAVGHVTYLQASSAVARGPFLFRLSVTGPQSAGTEVGTLLGELLAEQAAKVPANTPDTGTSLNDLNPDHSNAAGYAIGALIAYLGIVNGIAYLRNPLRRRLLRGRARPAKQWPAGQRVLDVSAAGRKYRNVAWGRFAAQFAGLIVVAYGAVSYPNLFLFVFLALAGFAIVWASGHFIRPGGPLLSTTRHTGTGARRVRVMSYRAIAAVSALAGGFAVVSYALNQSTPPAVQAAAAEIEALGAPSQDASLSPAILWLGIILLAIGAIIARHARRLTKVDAYRLMQQDSRPPVLYLRAFRDDKLKLLSATLGRPSLIERFTPRRFDAFEEVITRHLSGTGPVIALNPPGTKLAPLGAARETLDSEGWQHTISDWMAKARLIVLVIPPAKVTDGLTWELETITTGQHWGKTLILVSPVRPGVLGQRWQAFRDACATRWPFSVPLSLDGPRPLALTFEGGEWTVVSAWRQHEWAYTAAIQGGLGELSGAATAGGESAALAGDDRERAAD